VIRDRVILVLKRWIFKSPDLGNDHAFMVKFNLFLQSVGITPQSFCPMEVAVKIHQTPRSDPAPVNGTSEDNKVTSRNNEGSNLSFVPERNKLPLKELEESIPLEPKESARGTLFLQLDSNELAFILTQIDKKLFDSIPLSEFLHKNYTKHDLSPQFTRMAQQFNQWSQWVATEVVSCSILTQRAEVLSKFITIAKVCTMLNNFNTSYAITAGMNLSSVNRLKQTWERIPKNILETFQELKELFHIEGNHKAYRFALAAATPPVVPYLGLYGKFLLGIEDGARIKNDNGIINLQQMRKLNRLICEICRFQKSSYNFRTDSFLEHYVNRIVTLKESEAFNQSLVCEPRPAALRATSRGKRREK